jgi:hypothetical protein
MFHYIIQFTPIAEQDLDELYDYIAYELALPMSEVLIRRVIAESLIL